MFAWARSGKMGERASRWVVSLRFKRTEGAMYGLRLINNFYADFAGTRSDFVVVGHPEYNLGKAWRIL